MQFEVLVKKFTLNDQLLDKLDKTLGKLKHALRTFSGFDNQGTIFLEKIARKKQYTAKINFNLPHHHVAASDIGVTPEQALHNASEDARDEVLKIKDLYKDFHEIFRRSKAS